MATAFEDAVIRVRRGAAATDEARRLREQMTLEEKLSCLDGDTPFWEGLIYAIGGGYYESTSPAAVNKRLGIPGIHFSDGPRGVVVGHCTAFPVSMARGATFDPDLEERIGDAIGRELRASGATFYGGVCVNLLRHPAWGRAQETYGEDPHHVGEMGAALTRGVQRHAMACVKHFACNSMENARFKVDVSVDERALHEVYLPHFRRVVAEGVASVMSAYNSVNGEWCGENQTLLEEILRSEWGFEGFVISDFQFGLRDAVKSVRAGLDIEMPYLQQRAMHLPEAVASGLLAEADVDRCVDRILSTLLRFAEVFDAKQPSSVIASEGHRALAREAAEKSIVLLRNEGELLPLAGASLRKVVVLGRLAATPNIGDGGSSNVHPPHIVTPLAGFQAALPGVEVVHSNDPSEAADADAAIVVVGYTAEDEGECIDPKAVSHLLHLYPPITEPDTMDRLRAAAKKSAAGKGFRPGGDRRSLTLSSEDEELLLAVSKINRRTIAVVMGGSAIVMERWRNEVPAIVMLWYPGMEGGHALADMLIGRANPSGRLPFAIPTDASHLVAFDRDADHAVYELFHGQWKLDLDGNVPAYPFGHGLSYTRFAIGGALVSGAGTNRSVSVTVENVGDRDGATTVFVFGSKPRSVYARPMRRLLGFKRVEVAAGARATVSIAASLETLAVRKDGDWIVESGDYELTVGSDAGGPWAARTRVAV